jgi:hypothetical protein
MIKKTLIVVTALLIFWCGVKYERNHSPVKIKHYRDGSTEYKTPLGSVSGFVR